MKFYKNIILFLFIIFSTSAPTLWGKLVWESNVVRVNAMQGDKEANLIFKFKNEGEKAITILDTKSSCGCTVPELTKKTYAPGESGELKAAFKVGNKVGLQSKKITVTTDDEASARTDLTVQVDIKVTVKVRPRFLFWKKGSEPTPRVVTVEVSPESGFQNLKDVRLESAFAINSELSEINKNKKVDPKTGNIVYQFEVAPTEINEPQRGYAWVELEGMDARTQQKMKPVSVHLRVR